MARAPTSAPMSAATTICMAQPEHHRSLRRQGYSERILYRAQPQLVIASLFAADPHTSVGIEQLFHKARPGLHSIRPGPVSRVAARLKAAASSRPRKDILSPVPMARCLRTCGCLSRQSAVNLTFKKLATTPKRRFNLDAIQFNPLIAPLPNAEQAIGVSYRNSYRREFR